MHRIELKMGGARTALRNAIAGLSDMTPVYADIGEYMTDATRQRFLRGVAPDGTAWAPKKASTLERYKRMGYGALNKALIGPSRRLSREIQTLVRRDGVLIGSSLEYAGVMQFGAAKGAFGNSRAGRPIPWGHIAARAWLGVSTEDERTIVEIVEEHLAEKLQSGS